MGFNREIDNRKWHEIGDKLTQYLRICSCQRKLKSIIGVLVKIHEKGQLDEPNWTPEEFFDFGNVGFFEFSYTWY